MKRAGPIVWKVARLVVTFALVLWLATRIEWALVWRALSSLSPLTGVALVALLAAMQLLFARRLQVMVAPLAVTPPSLGALVRVQLSGAAASSVLPSVVGGDVVRTLLVARLLGGEGASARALSLIVVERIMGLLSLCTLPIVLGLTWYRSVFGPWAVAAAAVLAGCIWQLAPLVAFVARVAPQRVKPFLAQVHEGLSLVSLRSRLACFGWSMAYQVVVGVFFELLTQSWGLGPRVHEAIWVGIPAAFVLTAVPVSIGGLGWRESLFVGVFELLGLPREQGLVLALVWTTQGSVMALLGALLLWRDPPPRQ